MGWDAESRAAGKPGKAADEAPREVDAESCPVTALGRRRGAYWFFSPSGELRDVNARTLHKMDGLADLFEADMAWLYANFGGGEGPLQVARAARWLIRQCVAAGLFDPAMPSRGPGVWREGDRLIVHCGDRVLDSGEWTAAGFRIGDVLYPLASRIAAPAEHPATAAECRALRDDIGLWRFEDSLGPDAIAGFIALANLGAAPDWRVHFFVRAPYGAGKSWLAELVANASGSSLPSNNITPASIYQGLTGEARALVIDEAEKSDHDDRIDRVIELIRLMSGRGGARVARGASDGKSRVYAISGSAFLTAILHPELKPQDRSRFIVLRLLALETGPGSVGQHEKALAALARSADMAPAIKARVIAGFPRFLATVAMYHAAALRDGVEQRSADSFAAVLAGRDLLLRDDLPAQSGVEGDLAAWSHLLVRERDRAGESEGDQCLIHLYSSLVETWGGGARHTIGEELGEARRGASNRNEINRTLGRCGLRIHFQKVKGQDDVAVLLLARRHVGLDRIFANTRWSGGVWTQALSDLDGASHWGTTHFGGSPSTRATALPEKYMPPPPDDDHAGGPSPEDLGA